MSGFDSTQTRSASPDGEIGASEPSLNDALRAHNSGDKRDGAAFCVNASLLYQSLHGTLVESLKEAQSLLEESAYQPRSIAILTQLLHQAGGALQLAGLNGALELIAEIEAQISTAGDAPFKPPLFDRLLESIQTLMRYLDYLHEGRQPLPALLLPSINRLRAVTGQPPLPDSLFDFGQFRPIQPLPDRDIAANSRTQASVEAQKRLRQLYQAGLTNILRDENIKPSLTWMEHALRHIGSGHDAPWRNTLWQLGALLLHRFSMAEAALGLGRKRLFSALDRQIRLQIDGADEASLEETLKRLLTELIYLLRLGESADSTIDHWLELIAAPSLGYRERDLLVGQLYLDGEDRHSLQSLVTPMLDELKDLRRYIEGLSLGTPFQHEVLRSFITQLHELDQILSIGSRHSPVEESAQLQQELARWLSVDDLPAEEHLKLIAERLVALEVRLLGFNHGDAGNPLDQQPPLLREAKQRLGQESRASLAICKQAIESYLNSAESLHLANLVEVLDSVRGALIFLDRSELIEVIEQSLRFITALPSHDQKSPPAQIEQLADTLIILEFLLATPAGQPLDTALLQLAKVTAATL